MADHRSQEPVEISYDRYSRESPGAHLFVIDGKPEWIPKSQMTDWDKEEKVFNLPEWLAYERGFI